MFSNVFVFPDFSPNRFLTVTQFVRLWRNECLRIFHDRLIDETDKALVFIIQCRNTVCRFLFVMTGFRSISILNILYFVALYVSFQM